MFKISLKGLACGLMALFLSGCTATTYTQAKDRVDQDMAGNAGYIQGTPRPVDRSQVRKTRKVYVLDIKTKGPKEPEVAKELPRVSSEPAPRPGTPSIAEEINRSLQSAPSTPAAQQVAAPAGPTEYKVEQGDTLQKISKKFYDTYTRWNKIYEANKEKIKDPNRIKPGIVITIPQK